jgi:hypothetical protein
MRVLNDALLPSTTVSLAATSQSQELVHMYVADLMAVITAANPANKNFASTDVIIGADTVTITGHGFTTGVKVTLTTAGALPTGLAVLTDYYLIVVDANTIKFATSQANALAGTAIDLTGAGSGTSTVVVTTTIAGSVKLQKTDDLVNVAGDGSSPTWFDVTSSSQNFTGTTTLNWALTDIGYPYLRTVVTVTSGTVTAAVRINAKGA